MEERKGGRAPLGVKDKSRDGAALGVAMREIFYALTARGQSRETQHPLSGVIEDISSLHHDSGQEQHYSTIEYRLLIITFAWRLQLG